MARGPLTPDGIRRAIAQYLENRKTCRRGHDVTADGALIVDSQGVPRCSACREIHREEHRIRTQQRRAASGACGRGHPWAPETTRTTQRNGQTIRHCMICDKADGARGGQHGMTTKAADAFLALVEKRDRAITPWDRKTAQAEIDACAFARRGLRKAVAP